MRLHGLKRARFISDDSPEADTLVFADRTAKNVKPLREIIKLLIAQILMPLFEERKFPPQVLQLRLPIPLLEYLLIEFGYKYNYSTHKLENILERADSGTSDLFTLKIGISMYEMIYRWSMIQYQVQFRKLHRLRQLKPVAPSPSRCF
jgi:hypothetical protein